MYFYRYLKNHDILPVFLLEFLKFLLKNEFSKNLIFIYFCFISKFLKKKMPVKMYIEFFEWPTEFFDLLPIFFI